MIGRNHLDSTYLQMDTSPHRQPVRSQHTRRLASHTTRIPHADLLTALLYNNDRAGVYIRHVADVVWTVAAHPNTYRGRYDDTERALYWQLYADGQPLAHYFIHRAHTPPKVLRGAILLAIIHDWRLRQLLAADCYVHRSIFSVQRPVSLQALHAFIRVVRAPLDAIYRHRRTLSLADFDTACLHAWIFGFLP